MKYLVLTLFNHIRSGLNPSTNVMRLPASRPLRNIYVCTLSARGEITSDHDMLERCTTNCFALASGALCYNPVRL